MTAPAETMAEALEGLVQWVRGSNSCLALKNVACRCSTFCSVVSAVETAEKSLDAYRQRQAATVVQAGEVELPEPFGHVPLDTGKRLALKRYVAVTMQHEPSPDCQTQIYTADQLRTYGDARARAARREALGEAAKACEGYVWESLPGRSLVKSRRSADSCAAAIRALIGKD